MRLPGIRVFEREKKLAAATQAARIDLNFDLSAYLCMPEHAHLMVRPSESKYDLAEIRKAIKAPAGSKASRYLGAESPVWIPMVSRNRGNKTERLFWQPGGGFDRNVIQPGTLRNPIGFIHMNPVRHGLVEAPEQ